MVATTRFWFFLTLFLISFTTSETRTLTNSVVSKERNGGVLLKKARDILEESTRRLNMEELSVRYKINRRSPGGPDPRHH